MKTTSQGREKTNTNQDLELCKGWMYGHETETKERKERKGVSTSMEIHAALPGECVPVCVDWDVWEMVLEEQTHPTNRVNAHTALPSLFTLLWLDFQRPRILPLKGDAEKNSNSNNNTLAAYVRKATSWNKISCFSRFLLTYEMTSAFLCFCHQDIFLHGEPAQNSELFPTDSLQALPRRTPQVNPSQWGVASSSRWTDGTTASPTPAAWSTCLCPTPTWQPRSWRSTVSAVIHTLQSWIRRKISIEKKYKDWDYIYVCRFSFAFAQD